MAKGSRPSMNVGGYTVEYNPRKYGQITRFEAGVLYKAVKNGNVQTKPETTKLLYNQADLPARFADERYNQNGQFYDRISDVTRAILNNDFNAAQIKINQIENDLINYSSKKSPYYKYR